VADFHRHVRWNAANFFAGVDRITETAALYGQCGDAQSGCSQGTRGFLRQRAEKMGGTGELDLQLLGALSDAWKKTLSGTGKIRDP